MKRAAQLLVMLIVVVAASASPALAQTSERATSQSLPRVSAVQPLSASPAKAAKVPGFESLLIVTIPAMPAARFSFDGSPVTTDARGMVHVQVPHSTKDHRVQLLNPTITGASSEAKFYRWWGERNHDKGFVPVITDLVMRHNVMLQVAFRVTYQIHYSFADQQSLPIASSRITNLVLQGDNGQTFKFQGGGTARLLGDRPTLIQSALVDKQVLYSLQSVMIDGSNVVNAGEQRFLPSQNTNQTFVVLLRSVRFTTHDFLFGNAVGSAVELTYPDGNTQQFPLGAGNDVGIGNLARGSYKVSVVGSGFSLTRPISLSRSQFVDLPVISYLDIAVVISVLVAIALGLILAGRYRLARKSRRRHARPILEGAS